MTSYKSMIIMAMASALFLRIKTVSYLTPTRSGSSKIYMSTTLPWWKYIIFINQSSCLCIISTIACYKKKMLIIINKTQHIIKRMKEIVKVVNKEYNIFENFSKIKSTSAFCVEENEDV